MAVADGWEWRAPPNWPPPPAGWRPPSGWAPPPEWSPAPPAWQFWVPARPVPVALEPLPVLLSDSSTRSQIVRETWFVMLAFLVLPLTSAVAVFAQHAQGDTGISRFPDIVHGHPLTNMLLGIFTYTPVVAAVPLAFLLLARTGQSAASLGFGSPRIIDDVWPGFGLAVLAFVSEFVLLIPLAPLLDRNSSLVNPVPIGNVPTYYLIWGIAASAMTAVAEETFMNGYFMTRLEQLGWSPNRALALSLAVRTSYHVYYGIGFLLTIPFGYFVTRSFQKHRRLNRVIAAHFLFDGALFTIAFLAH